MPEFVFDEPFPFLEELPAPDREAISLAEAQVAPEAVVIDAIRTSDGLLALVLEADGPVLLFPAAEPPARAGIPVAPEEALRLLPSGEAPLRVLVVMSADRAIQATRTSPGGRRPETATPIR